MGKVYLVATSADYAQELALDSGTAWTIGRSSDNTLVCPDKSMSRRHAVIEQVDQGRFFFVDLGSSNGSALNGRRITVPIELRDGDAVQCGGTTVTFYATAEASGTGPAKEADDGTAGVPLWHAITVLVADIRDFTRLAGQLDEAVLAQTLGTWFRHAGTIVHRHGASDAKFIGDSVIARWTHRVENSVAREICASLHALLEIEEFTHTLQQQFSLPEPLRVGAAVNTRIPGAGGIGPEPHSDQKTPNAESESFRLEVAAKKAGLDIAFGDRIIELLAGGGDIRQYLTRQSVELEGPERLTEAWFTSFAKLKAWLAARSQK